MPISQPHTERLAWRKPVLRRMDALDAQAKTRARQDFLHLS